MSRLSNVSVTLLMFILYMVISSSCSLVDRTKQLTRTPTPSILPVQTEHQQVEITATSTSTTIPELTPYPTKIENSPEITPTNALTPSPEETSRHQSIGAGWIAYVEWYGKHGIDVIHTGRKSLIRIVDREGFYNHPSWSPDGQWIVFTFYGENSTQTELFLARPDGTEVKRLTFSTGNKQTPSWSPDGEKIVYSQVFGHIEEAEVDLYMIESDGSRVTRLTNTLGIFESNPTFSPDGDYIAFLSTTEEKNVDQYDLMIMNIDGMNIERIIDLPAGDSKITWSPDSEQIAFRSSEGCGDIFIVNKDGSGLKQITKTPGRERDPTWSYDGKYIAFNATVECDDMSESVALGWQIYIIELDGNDVLQLTDNIKSYPLDPAWAPIPALEIGKSFVITKLGENLRLRSIPSLEGNILEKVKMNEEILVVDGPVKADGFLWWKVRIITSDIEGWLADNPGWFTWKE